MRMKNLSMQDAYRVSRISYLIEAALEYFISIMVTGAFLARITTSLGFSDSLTGILSSFVSLGCVFQLGTIAVFGGRQRIKRLIIAGHLVNQTMFALVYLTPVLPLGQTAKTALFLLCFCGAYMISNVIAPTKMHWLMGLVEDKARGSFTAKKESLSLLGGMVFTYLMGSAMDRLEAAGNQRMTFILGGIVVFALMMLHALSLVWMVEKPASAEKTGGIKQLLKNPMFLRVLPISLLWYVATYSATPFYGAYQIKELGFSMTFISVLSIMYSVVRMAASPLMGRYADRASFARMVSLCFCVAAAGFLVNCFTVPENGKVFYSLYNVLYAVAMAGINSSLVNLVYDHVQGEGRSTALAISSALGGVCGFLTTCLMSTVVSRIQAQGNRFLGLSLYPTQVVSAVALLLTLLVIGYLRVCVIPKEKEH